MYTFDSRVRYSEISANGCLDLTSIINYFQDCSTFQSEDLGIGIDYMNQHNKAWVLTSWQIEIKQYPALGEQITIGTWAYAFDRLYGYRNFIMKNQRDEVVAFANAIWILMDLTNKRPVKVDTIDIKKYPLEEKYTMHYSPRKISIPENLETMETYPVVRSNIDTNNHVNNSEYIKMAENYLPANFTIHKMRAEYKNQAVLGDIIVAKRFLDCSTCTVMLCNETNTPYAIIEFQ